MPMDEVRVLDICYAAALGVLNKQLIEDEGHSNPMTSQELAERMRKWLKHGYTCFGIIANKEPIAYALYRDDGEYFHLRQLYTARNFRHQGLASRLLEYLQDNIFVEKPVRLEVLSGNVQALEFYRKRGFDVYCHTLISGE